MAGMLKRVAPLSFEAWVDYELAGAHLSRGELDAVRRLVQVAGDGVAARAGASLGREELARMGLSNREIEELVMKLGAQPTIEAFDLDPSAARPAEEFARIMEAAVPRVDRR